MSRFSLGVVSQIAAPAGVTMVAGTSSLGNIGYGTLPIFDPTYGSLSDQPYDGLTVTVLGTDSSVGMSLIFDGDVAATVASLTLYVDNVAYPLERDYPVAYYGPDYGTEAYWDTGANFLDSVSYNIRVE